MTKRLFILSAMCANIFSLGCASTWEKVSNRKFWKDPVKSTFQTEDPMYVLRNKVDGTERAEAMRRLKEPARNGRTAQEQEEALQMLGHAATSDPSPVVRIAAIDALARFEDPRTTAMILAAYHQASALSSSTKVAEIANGVQQTAASKKEYGGLDLFGLNGPTGFQPEFVSAIRVRAIDGLGTKTSPEVIGFLASLTQRQDTNTLETSTEHDIRVAAVKQLGQMRDPQAVQVLAKVLEAERQRDVTLASRAHEGLVQLTGKNLPPEPAQWNQVVQAGAQVAPEPNLIQQAIGWISD